MIIFTSEVHTIVEHHNWNQVIDDDGDDDVDVACKVP